MCVCVFISVSFRPCFTSWPPFIPLDRPVCGLGPGTEDSGASTTAPCSRHPGAERGRVAGIPELLAGGDRGVSTGDSFHGRESHLAYDLFCANSSDFPTFAAFG